MAPALAVDATIFVVVVVAVVVVGLIVAVVLATAGRDAYDQIGRGGLGGDAGSPGPDRREEEISQMLGARRARLAAREEAGWRPAPVPAPADADPGLAEEIRQVVVAGNARRRSRGLAPLDVEAEVARRMGER